MAISRRQYLKTGAGAALAAASGCSQMPVEVRTAFRQLVPEKGPLVAPNGVDVGLMGHLLNRIAFGPRGNDYSRNPQHYLEEQLNPDRIDDSKLERALERIESLSFPLGELYELKEKTLLADMTKAAILRAVWSERQLYERMVHFWTDHFNIDSSKGDCKWLKAADDRMVIRPHAMGSFPAMLKASILSPAMLWYLDGRVNKKEKAKDKPNENYARELMELQTLGVHGGYSQQDVMEVARCLTGWTVRSVKQFNKGRVEFVARLHDDGPKVVLGQQIPAGLGEGDVDRVLEIVSLHPSTAQHIATKLCRRFIADDPCEAAVAQVAKAFLDSRGDVSSTLRAVFLTPDFEKARGNKLKRPFEFIVSALRATGAETDGGKQLADYLVQMGHAPFQYPTPEGYPDTASHWMGTLLWRWKFAVALSRNTVKGTRIEPESADIAYLLGRLATAEEASAYRNSGNDLALILASPAFQTC